MLRFTAESTGAAASVEPAADGPRHWSDIVAVSGAKVEIPPRNTQVTTAGLFVFVRRSVCRGRYPAKTGEAKLIARANVVNDQIITRGEALSGLNRHDHPAIIQPADAGGHPTVRRRYRLA